MRQYTVLCVATLLGIVGAAATLPAEQAETAHPSTTAPVPSATIHREVDFTATPARLYEALLDSKQFSEFSGRLAEIRREVGGACWLFGGHIVAVNVELVPNRRIVQAWRVVDWPEGVWSVAKFELTAKGSGTHLVFDHAGFPQELRDHLALGWEANYWSLLQKSLH